MWNWCNVTILQSLVHWRRGGCRAYWTMSELPTQPGTDGASRGGIVWLVSHPKSGNTWLRALVLNLQRDGDSPVRLDELGASIRYASGRLLIDNYAGVETSELDEAETTELRARVYDFVGSRARASGTLLFFRCHEAFSRTPSGAPLVSRQAASGVVYLVRNPLDVAVSYAHHFACDLDRAIDRLADDRHQIFDSPDRLYWHPRQRYRTWSRHVESWVDESNLPILLLRYEDMSRNPEDACRQVAEFAGLPADRQRLTKAVRFSSFAELQRQEERKGFAERNPDAPSFFRRGTVDGWRTVLTACQVRRVIDAHRRVMRRFGYVDDGGEPIPQAAGCP